MSCCHTHPSQSTLSTPSRVASLCTSGRSPRLAACIRLVVSLNTENKGHQSARVSVHTTHALYTVYTHNTVYTTDIVNNTLCTCKIRCTKGKMYTHNTVYTQHGVHNIQCTHNTSIHSIQCTHITVYITYCVHTTKCTQHTINTQQSVHSIE